jgi:hypothetical protein
VRFADSLMAYKKGLPATSLEAISLDLLNQNIAD